MVYMKHGHIPQPLTLKPHIHLLKSWGASTCSVLWIFQFSMAVLGSTHTVASSIHRFIHMDLQMEKSHLLLRQRVLYCAGTSAVTSQHLYFIVYFLLPHNCRSVPLYSPEAKMKTRCTDCCCHTLQASMKKCNKYTFFSLLIIQQHR